MPLWFRFGTVSSAKTAELLVKAHSVRTNEHRKCAILKPSIDTRHEHVWSRVPGLEAKPDLIVNADDEIPELDVDVIFVDECQFFSPIQINQLWMLSLTRDVYCYGLRTDYKGKLFPGSKRLMELANTIEQIESRCHYCGLCAQFNIKLVDGEPSTKGSNDVEIGCEELYLPACSKCTYEKIEFTEYA